ncbi:Collagen alpha-4(VI) chain [Actinoplanes sp. SE50]|uniref:hypothetical protein n=1 Tax=unclassified Actinoplanes TaxID=2626549 RepID=UPI00023EC9FB|nr:MULTISPECIES: hypothetical protein [unclassified Actinoplanes]AEV86519.1 Collagen alpha-4(VI) chain [Actinoplanes sp. SE50/110]ATO84917.1 Collagen alpha-4(VI) chain [Actinoplanes sp. SE50]SLM02326.1 hypothetical protein ACSP50_5565 [Actinoplanes sp. SE50/110]
MSREDERVTLDPAIPLFTHAARLHAATPDTPLLETHLGTPPPGTRSGTASHLGMRPGSDTPSHVGSGTPPHLDTAPRSGTPPHLDTAPRSGTPAHLDTAPPSGTPPHLDTPSHFGTSPRFGTSPDSGTQPPGTPVGTRPPGAPVDAPLPGGVVFAATSPGSAAPSGRATRPGLRALLDAYFAAPDAIARLQQFHDALAAQQPPAGELRPTLRRLLLTGDDGMRERIRLTGRCLIGAATELFPAQAGLAMLAEAGEPIDAAPIRLLGRLDPLSHAAIAALEALGASTDLIWLADRSSRVHRHFIARALCRLADPPAVAWLRARAAADERGVTPLARDAIDVIDLAAELTTTPPLRAVPPPPTPAPPAADPTLAGPAPPPAAPTAPASLSPAALSAASLSAETWERAARLVLRLGRPHDYSRGFDEFHQLVRLARAVARHAPHLPGTPARWSLIAQLATELSTGRIACADWSTGDPAAEGIADTGSPAVHGAGSDSTPGPDRFAGDRQSLVAALTGRLPVGHGPGPSTFDVRREPVPPTGFHIRVVAADPDEGLPAETRIVVDGRPVIPAAFHRGPPNPPKFLLAQGQLRADPEPQEVQLAEAWCTEGCCGALYVTIVRDPESDQVTWHDWRGHTTPEPPPSLHFPGEEYDAELARATHRLFP